MALLVFQHVAHEPPARLGQILQSAGHRLRVVELFAGQAVPQNLDDVNGVVSLGGPMNIDQTAQHPWIQLEMNLLEQAHLGGIPVVGICLGAQLIAKALGGEVTGMETPEVGWHPIELSFPGTSDTIFSGSPWRSTQFHLHAQQITELPRGATMLCSSTLCRNQVFRVGLRTYGFQYHFEWDQDQIRGFVDHPLTTGATNQIIEGINQYYNGYRRLGDRLTDNLASFLFPIEKQHLSRAVGLR